MEEEIERVGFEVDAGGRVLVPLPLISTATASRLEVLVEGTMGFGGAVVAGGVVPERDVVRADSWRVDRVVFLVSTAVLLGFRRVFSSSLDSDELWMMVRFCGGGMAAGMVGRKRSTRGMYFISAVTYRVFFCFISFLVASTPAFRAKSNG